jgi:putative transposase
VTVLSVDLDVHGKEIVMREWQRLSHVKWYCRYHVVIVPKYRKKVIFGTLRRGIGKILRELCEQEGIELVEGRAMSDHVHLCLGIPPKFSVANTVGFLKGKSTIRIHREHLGKDRNFTGFHFWAQEWFQRLAGNSHDRRKAMAAGIGMGAGYARK